MVGQAGLMSDVDILSAIKAHEIAITPYDPEDKDDKRLTPSGFNFSFSRFIVSLNRKVFYKIYEKDAELYFFIAPGDTAIALTYESIWVSNKIGGTFHSKVGYVSQGLGHISTTLDPGWQGQLLISINNPSKKSIKVVIGTRNDNNEIIYNSFITLYLFRVISGANRRSDNNSSRLDTLLNILQTASHNKQREELIGTVTEMLTFLLKQDTHSLSSKTLVTQQDIKDFCKDHKLFLEKWNTKYADITKRNRRVVLRNRITLILFAMIVITFLLLMFAFKIDENIKWIISIIIAISIPFAEKTIQKYW